MLSGIRIEQVAADAPDAAAELLTRFFAEEGFSTASAQIARNLAAMLSVPDVLERARNRGWEGNWHRHGHDHAVCRVGAAWRNRRPFMFCQIAACLEGSGANWRSPYKQPPHDVGDQLDVPIQYEEKEEKLWELNTYVTGEVLGFPNKLAFFTGRDQSQLRTSYFAQLRAGLPFTLRL